MSAKDWLQQGRPRLGLMTALADPMVADIVARAGFDWVWIDGEHGDIDVRTAGLHAAIYRGKLKSYARVPDKSPSTLGRFLDAGVDGLIIPQINSTAELTAALDACFYPPLGKRGMGASPANSYGMGMAEYIARPPYTIFAQVETVGAVADIDNFVADERLGGILIGPFDLSAALGQLGNVGHPDVQAAIARTLAACKARNLPCGIFCLDPETARRYAEQGFDMVGMGVDATTLLSGLSASVAAFRA